MTLASENSQVADHWASREPLEENGGFYVSPLVRPYIIETAFGKDQVEAHRANAFYSIDIFIEKFLRNRPIKSIISLCCGFGNVERYFVTRLPGVEYCLGLDLSEGALAHARQRAQGLAVKMEYAAADLNDYDWKPHGYDLVIANGALHHISNLEGVLDGMRRTLKPGGLLYACEYVGPSYMAHPPRQLELINALAFMMPPELRARKPIGIRNDRLFRLMSKAWEICAREERASWAPWQRAVSRLLKKILRRQNERFDFGVVYRSPKEYLLRTDPSECVRSSEILNLINSYFPSARVLPFGGGILQHALDQNFYDHFDPANKRHAALLQLLTDLERGLMAAGEIGPENAFIFADTAVAVTA
ncbi:Methyltransferase domain-containing protein [Bradyrhizobium lablabi]|uniref:Methyltransferase domain-containing protein n=1 Tax=Bradyrhizobium lablabi TaxID=722472 RepID=A0A1M7BEA0_9BRAD|nr:class I SAM-dependent methyltransferase [Bradyrhizobium lablabi]SHL53254.1 Methyltransferase domain-containing protein [Bradyrhizobium lablabi]